MSSEGPTSKVVIMKTTEDLAAEQKSMDYLVRTANLYHNSCKINGPKAELSVQFAHDLADRVITHARRHSNGR